jgi:hypothetical protein
MDGAGDLGPSPDCGANFTGDLGPPVIILETKTPDFLFPLVRLQVGPGSF